LVIDFLHFRACSFVAVVVVVVFLFGAAAGAAVVAIAVALRGEWWGLFDVLHVMVVGVVLVAKGGLRGETFS